MPARNLELKSRCADLAAAARAAEALGATWEWTKSQTDTYFHVPHGRLKLREQDGRPAELIGYERPDRPDARVSEYTVVPVPDGDLLTLALVRTLGVRVVVAKRRTLYLWHNVRIHLDDVERLGTFVEFEAVLTSPEDEAESPNRIARLAEALNLRAGDHIAGSYSDLLARGSAS